MICVIAKVSKTNTNFLFRCKALKRVRKAYLKSDEVDWSRINKKDHNAIMKLVLSKKYIKFGAKWIDDMYNTRKGLLYR